MVNFGLKRGQVDGHTLDGVLADHFDVISACHRNRASHPGICAWICGHEGIELPGWRDRPASNDFAVSIQVQHPAAVRVKVGRVLAAKVEGWDGNEPSSGTGNEKNVMEGKNVTRSGMQVDCADPDCIHAGVAKPFDRVGGAWPQTFEVRTLRGDMVGGPSIENKWASLIFGDRGLSGRMGKGRCNKLEQVHKPVGVVVPIYRHRGSGLKLKGRVCFNEIAWIELNLNIVRIIIRRSSGGGNGGRGRGRHGGVICDAVYGYGVQNWNGWIRVDGEWWQGDVRGDGVGGGV